MAGYQNTPVEKDDFTRTLVNLFSDKDLIGIPQGGQSIFGDPSSGSRTVYSRDKNTVEIAILRGNDEIAALVPRGGIPGIDLSTPKLVEAKQSVFQRVYPLAEDEYPIRAGQLLFAIPGESDEQRVTREDRMMYLAQEGAAEMVRRVGRLNEYLAWQSILTGKQPAIIGTTDANLLYDFLRPSGHTVAVGTEWGTGDPWGDISTGVAAIRAAAHVTPDYCLLASDSWSNMVKNTTLVGLAENPGYNLLRMGPEDTVPSRYNRMVANGFMCVGVLVSENGARIYLFLYEDTYTLSGTSYRYLPSGYAVLGYSGARCDRYFGPPEVMPMAPSVRADFRSLFGFNLDNPPIAPNARPGNVFDPNSLYFDAYPHGNNKGWTIRVQAAPIFATTMTDAFYVMTGCHS